MPHKDFVKFIPSASQHIFLNNIHLLSEQLHLLISPYEEAS